ncbi:MAG: hypothetical protein JW744_04100, partial [Candidatus Diapherotrites archaeon]|nr:hypothetical protein [Candidatus Diapherotrites archaeon]
LLEKIRRRGEQLESQRFVRGRVGAMLREAHLPSLAKEIVSGRDLPASKTGRSILRLGLQKAFLKKAIDSRRGYQRVLPSAEKACLDLVQNTEKAHTLLWDFQHKKIGFQQGAEMYEAAAEIMKEAQAAFKADPKYNLGKLRDMGEKARGNASMLRSNIAAGAKGSMLQVSQTEVFMAARVGEKLIERISKQLPEETQIGLELVEDLVQENLGGEQ